MKTFIVKLIFKKVFIEILSYFLPNVSVSVFVWQFIMSCPNFLWKSTNELFEKNDCLDGV